MNIFIKKIKNWTPAFAGVTAFFFSLSPAQAAPQSFSLSGQNGRNQITFFSEASIENFDGFASDFYGTVSVDFSDPGLAMTGEVAVAVASMQTGLAMRDKHMRSNEWLDAEHYPTIRFKLASAGQQKVVKKSEGEWLATATGTFDLKGHTKQISVPVSLKKKGNDIIIAGQFNISLEEFGIHGPPAMKMIGLRVGSDVMVKFKLAGKAERGWPAPQGK